MPPSSRLLRCYATVTGFVRDRMTTSLSATSLTLLSWPIMPYGWQYLFLIGTVPALLVVAVMRRLKEPEAWQQAKAQAHEKKAEMHESKQEAMEA